MLALLVVLMAMVMQHMVRSSALHYTYIQAYMPYKSSEDPVGLPLDSLGPLIGIKDQLTDLSRPIWLVAAYSQ